MRGEGKLSGESFPSPRAPHPFKDFRLVGRRHVGFPVREREMCLSKWSVCSQKNNELEWRTISAHCFFKLVILKC
ncbi:hypothetical protein WCP94_002366 [Bilophila wadsworthia]